MVNAREQITQARANISSQRQMLEQRRREVESSEKSAVEAREQMLSQRELRGRTIQDLPSARARKSEIERVQESAGKVRGRIVEAEQQLEEQEKQVSQYEKEAIAYETLNKEIARSGGITRGTSQGRIKEAFERAGLDPEEGTRIYMEQVGSSVGFGVDSQGTYAKKYADFIEYDELPTQQELTDMGARPGDVVTQTVSTGDTPGTLSLTYSTEAKPVTPTFQSALLDIKGVATKYEGLKDLKPLDVLKVFAESPRKATIVSEGVGYMFGTLGGGIAQEVARRNIPLIGGYKPIQDIAGKTGYFVGDVGSYFIPVVREVRLGLLVGKGTESFVTKEGREELKERAETFKEKGISWGISEPTSTAVSYGLSYGLPVAEIGLGVYGLGRGFGLFKTSLEKARTIPSGITRASAPVVKTEVITGTSKITKNIPRKSIIDVGGKRIITDVRGGVVDIQKPTGARVITQITSPKDKTFKLVEASTKDGTVGFMERTIKGERFVTKFETKGTELISRTFKDGKLVLKTKEPITSGFGLTEPVLVSKGVTSKTIPQADSSKLRIIKSDKIFEQKIVPLEKTKIKLVDEPKLQTLVTTKRTTIVSPAERVFSVKQKEVGKPVVELLRRTKESPKFSKQQSIDFKKIDRVGIDLGDKRVGVISYQDVSPRFADVIRTQQQAKAEYKIVSESFDDITSGISKSQRQFFLSKKAQVSLFDITKEAERLKPLETSVKIPRFASIFEGTTGTFAVLPREPITKVGIGTLTTAGLVSQVKSAQRQEQISLIETIPKTETISRTDTKTIQQPKPDTITRTLTSTTQITIPQLKLKTETIQVPEVIKLSPQKTRTQEIKTPILKIPKIIPKLPLEKKRKLTAKEELGRLFEVFARAKGKDIKIGEELTLRGATRKLATELKGTLKASGFITEKRTGKKVRFTEVAGILGGEFEPAKKDIFRIVQKKERRLGTGSEVFKIQRARKSGGFKWL